MIYQFNNQIPIISKTSFVHPLASVTGNVIIGANCYIGPHAAIRGDWGKIIIEDGCNIQENCTVHMFPGTTVLLKKNAHIGHGAVIHGATIGENCLVGMNTVIMDHVILGNECIVGALSFIKANEKFDNRSLIVGNPAKKIKEVTNDMIAWKTKGTELYKNLATEMQDNFKEVAPIIKENLSKIEIEQFYKNEQTKNFKTWQNSK